jgi:hypothetical protein
LALEEILLLQQRVSNMVPWVAAEDSLLLSLLHKNLKGGRSNVWREFDDIAAIMNSQPPRDKFNNVYRIYSKGSVSQRWHKFLKLQDYGGNYRSAPDANIPWVGDNVVALDPPHVLPPIRANSGNSTPPCST